MLHNQFQALSMLLVLVLLCGCVQYDESLQIDESGGGIAKIALSHLTPSVESGKIMASEFDRRFTQEAMSKNLPAGITLDYHRTDAAVIEIHAAYRFDSVNSLIAWAAANDSPLGNISVVQKDGLFEITRHFPADPIALASVKAETPTGIVRFTLTGPGDLLKNNANRTNDNTAIWEFMAPALFEGGGKTLAAQYGARNMSWIYPMLALIFVSVTAAIWIRSRPKRQVS